MDIVDLIVLFLFTFFSSYTQAYGCKCNSRVFKVFNVVIFFIIDN